tara:strand:+ start:384 stop:1190 length:807 start_codon:yes stop_codon:yes gene_type:complete
MSNMLNKVQLVDELVNRINESKLTLKKQWKNNDKSITRCLIIDDLIPNELCRFVFDDYLSLKENFIVGNYLFKQNKKTCNDLKNVSLQTKNLYSAFHSKEFLKAIEDIVEIYGLKPDPTLYAGGLTMMDKGDYLNPHIDNSHDRYRKRYRRLNILFYISPNWTLQNGGNLELWDRSVTKGHCIVSKFNRLVIMETNKLSWHSVSPVRVNEPRCCLSTYYFTNESPEPYEYFHVTSFQGRPEQKLLRSYSKFDNSVRRLISKLLKRGRG